MSILNVNQIQPVGSGQTVTISAANISAGSATVTAGTFSGNLSSSGISTFSDTVNVGAGKSIRLYGATSGYSEIIAAAGSASTTFTLPANGGSASQYLQTDGAGVLSWQTLPSSLSLTEATTTSTSGSVVNFGSISSDAKDILITFKDVSVSTIAYLRFRLGTSAGLATSGYQCLSVYQGQGTSYDTHTDYNQFDAGNSATAGWDGFVRLINVSGNVWYVSAQMGDPTYPYLMMINSSITLSGALTQVEFYFSTGNFDSGSWVIRYLT